MKHLVYIFTRDANRFHVGHCTNIEETAKKYGALISLLYPNKPNVLVYLEQLKDKEEAKTRVDAIMSLTKSAKIALIEKSNKASNELVIRLDLKV